MAVNAWWRMPQLSRGRPTYIITKHVQMQTCMINGSRCLGRGSKLRRVNDIWVADKITHYSQRTWPQWVVPYRLWRFAHRFEHPKFTPYYFSLALILLVTHVYIYMYILYIYVYIYVYIYGLYGPHLYHFCSGFDPEFLLDRMCSSKKCSSFCFLCIASELGDNCQVSWPSDPNSIKLPCPKLPN